MERMPTLRALFVLERKEGVICAIFIPGFTAHCQVTNSWHNLLRIVCLLKPPPPNLSVTSGVTCEKGKTNRTASGVERLDFNLEADTSSEAGHGTNKTLKR